MKEYVERFITDKVKDLDEFAKLIEDEDVGIPNDMDIDATMKFIAKRIRELKNK